MELELKYYDLVITKDKPYLVEGKDIVAGPEHFGWSINYGPPHDHNHDWLFDKKNGAYVYLEDLHPNTLDNLDKVLVVVEEHEGKIRPVLYEGKLLMDTYGEVLEWNPWSILH